MWTQHSQNYVKTVLTTVEKSIEHWEYDMSTKALTSFSHKYSIELDITPELDADDTRLCQAWVKILRWAVALGRLNIYLEVSLI